MKRAQGPRQRKYYLVLCTLVWTAGAGVLLALVTQQTWTDETQGNSDGKDGGRSPAPRPVEETNWAPRNPSEGQGAGVDRSVLVEGGGAEDYSSVVEEIEKETKRRSVYMQAELAGGLNNQRICLINALGLAKLANLTLITPVGLAPFSQVKQSKQLEQKTVPLADYFDLATAGEGMPRIVSEFPKWLQKKKASIKKGTSRQTIAGTLHKIREVVVGDVNYIKMKCQFSIDWRAVFTGKHITGRGTATEPGRSTEHLVTSLILSVKPSKAAVDAADSLVATLLGDVSQKRSYTYNVLHVRAEPDWVLLRATGVTKALESLGIAYPTGTIPQQEATAAFEAAASFGMRTDDPLFIAGGTPCTSVLIKNTALRFGFTKVWCSAIVAGKVALRKLDDVVDTTQAKGGQVHDNLAGMSYKKAVADQLVAERAALFVGRKESSFSSFVAYTRRNSPSGNPLALPSVSYIPAYDAKILRHSVPQSGAVGKDLFSSTELDAVCFGFPCTLPSVLFGPAGGSEWGRTSQNLSAVVDSVAESAARVFDASDVACHEQALATRFVGTLTGTDPWPCSSRTLFSWVDFRLLQPVPIVAAVSRRLANRFENADFGAWLHRWTPPYLRGLLVARVGIPERKERTLGFYIFVVDEPEAQSLPFDPLEVFVACSSAGLCVNQVHRLRERGIVAHRLTI
ncbi:hypothetical protein DIPPA_06486 [Diplonema papillatum]|nr:hypothetical protein DIPPA_06486 [Diplonema papillatum]